MSPQGWQDDQDGEGNKAGNIATVQVNNLIPGGNVVADATGTLQLGTPNAIGSPGGISGADGEDGDRGPPGTPGAAGLPGSAGAPGAPGSPGIGIDGEDGTDAWIPGPAGAAGSAGAPGPTSVPLMANDGEDGQDAWVPGPAGVAGAAGSTGAPGPASVPLWTDGEDGQDGQPGIPGVAGAAGATGAPGPATVPLWQDGEDGADGMTIPGAAGIAGATGTAGAVGAPGPTGLHIWGNDGEDGGDAWVRGAPGATGTTGNTGATGASGPPLFGTDGEDGADAGARTPVWPAAPQVLVSNGPNANPIGDPNFVYSGGRLSVGQATFDAIQHTVLANDTAPGTITAWDTRHAVFGASGSTGAGVGISHTSGTATSNVSALTPNSAWENLRLQALAFALYSGGATLGLSQDSSGNVFLAHALQLTALGGNAGDLLKVDASGNVGLAVPGPITASFKFSINWISSASVLPNSQTVIVPGDSGSISTGSSAYNAPAAQAVATTLAGAFFSLSGPVAYTANRTYTSVIWSLFQLNAPVSVASGANIQYSLWYTTSLNTAGSYTLLALFQTGVLGIGTSIVSFGPTTLTSLSIAAGAYFLITAHRTDAASSSVVASVQFTSTVEFIV